MKGEDLTMRTVWFDMDGTIADLYGVENWLPKLRASDPSPYAEAKPMLNFSLLARYLNQLQKKGYKIGIVSWASKGGSKSYNKEVASTKLAWLKAHLRSVRWNRIVITVYGVEKSKYMQNTDDILFDDNEEIRNSWIGDAYEPSQIMEILKGLVKDE
jgi:hypothetical protein